jgi:hypothetical protein
MDLSHLTEQEKIALGVLVKQIAVADQVVTVDEGRAVSWVVAAIGPELFARAERIKVPSHAALMSFLATVTRQSARDKIFGILRGVAQADGEAEVETEFLTAIARAWELPEDLEAS